MIIREIPYISPWYEKSKQLRQDVLRTPIGLALSEKDVAGEDQQTHIVAVDGDSVVGVMILKPLAHDLIKFRQIAVLQGLQGQGVGRRMMAYSENIVRNRNFHHVEMNARVTAQVFYEKLGYAATGDLFTEVGLDTIKMVKAL